MSDYLVEIEKINWPILKDLYTPDGEKSYTAFTTIDNYIRWFEEDSNIKHVKFVCLNGDFSDGTFVVTVRWCWAPQYTIIIIYKNVKFQDRSTAFADTNNKDYDRLFRLVAPLDFSKGFSFHSIREEIQMVIENAIKHVGIDDIMHYVTLKYFCPN